jgi:hypothetical protein
MWSAIASAFVSTTATTRTFQRSQVGNLRLGDRVQLDANSFHRV